MSKRNSLPSAHDVARLAGVSQAAVSRAFSVGASISKETRSKVLEAAKALDYRPNLLARSLITGRSGIVGVVIGSPRNPFYLEALNCLSDRLARAGQHLLVFTASAEGHADEFIDFLLQFRVDALLLMSATLSSELAERCRAKGIPVVFFSRRAKTLDGFPCISAANYTSGASIAHHLLEQGYRSFAFMGGSANSSTSQERGAGFMDVLQASGLPIPLVDYGNYDRQGAAAAACRLLSRDDRPEAIFCANDMMALATIETARFEFGLRIGRELGVTGFDDIEGSSWLSFRLTTYAQPIETMIEKATEIILEPAKFADAPPIVVEGELKIRESTQRDAKNWD